VKDCERINEVSRDPDRVLCERSRDLRVVMEGGIQPEKELNWKGRDLRGIELCSKVRCTTWVCV